MHKYCTVLYCTCSELNKLYSTKECTRAMEVEVEVNSLYRLHMNLLLWVKSVQRIINESKIDNTISTEYST